MTKRKSESLEDEDVLEEFIVAKKARIGATGSATDGSSGSAERRSSRIRAKKEAQAVAAPSQPQMQSQADSTKAKGKRARKSSTDKQVTRRRKNSKVGCLEMLMDMPIEIFCEIASNLSPHDLVNMARLSKSLRNLLMSKGSKSVWRAARENLGLPACPPDLSEPKFADLIFCKGCYFCEAPRAQTLHFSLRLRLCKSCSEKNVVLAERLDCYKDIMRKDPSFLSLVPYVQVIYSTRCYHVDQLKAIWAEYQSIEPNSEEMVTFVRERTELVRQISDNAKEVQNWIKDVRLNRQRDQVMIGRQREEKIREKLKAIGYNDMDLDPTLDSSVLHSKWRKLVKEPKLLTDRIWSNIQSQLEGLIADRQKWREELEARALTDDHDSLCSCSDCLDSDSDFGMMDFWDIFDSDVEDMYDYYPYPTIE